MKSFLLYKSINENFPFVFLRMVPEWMTVTDNPNILHWSYDSGYTGGIFEPHYPLRMFKANIIGDLSVTMRLVKRDIGYVCVDPIHGFNVILGAPGEIIKEIRQSLRVPPQEQALVSIKPKRYITSEGIRHYKPHKRQCFYSDERQLRFFKFYDKYNCEAECLANFTQRECGCVKFSLPSMIQ